MALVRMFAPLVAFALITGPAGSHEFWIDPARFAVAPGEAIEADLRVGEAFAGGAQSYLPSRFRRFELVQGAEATPVEGRLGDRPALNQGLSGDGLAVVVHETTDSRLTYREFAKFENFVRHKDAEWTIEAHRARGLPDSGFVEVYSRYAKALVAVGAGAGRDRVVGMETELVAQANPYTDDIAAGLPVILLYQRAPRAEAQIEVFEKSPSGDVAVSTVRTDAQGVARVPVRPGHRYMLDAVVLRPPEPPGTGANAPVWESLWANLTFAVPAR